MNTVIWECVVEAMLLLLAAVSIEIWFLRNRTVRVYNRVGQHYHYLGSVLLHKKHSFPGFDTSNDYDYVIKMNKRLFEPARTTIYRFCPGREFIRRHRYEEIMLKTPGEAYLLPVEECMEKKII